MRVGTPRRRLLPIDRVDPAVRRRPADDRPVEQLLLAEPMDAPAELGDQPRAEDDRVEVRGVVGGEDQRALPRDLVDRALDRGSGSSPERRAGRRNGQRRDERRDRALDRRGRGCVARSCAGAAVRQLVGAARLGVADGVDDGVDRVLETVAVGRDDPRVRRRPAAARRRGSNRARRGGAAPRGWPSASGPSGSMPRSCARRRARSSTDASR